MDHRRRPFLTEPGEPLLLTRDALGFAERFSEFSAFTMLPTEQIIASPLLTQPLVVKSRSAGPRGLAPTMNPGALWHPLFWLPERVAFRYRWNEDGVQQIEDDTEWSVRVALEVTMSGLYDPADGTWLDVLSVQGLDVEDAAVQQRLTDWLRGQPDALLDEINLSAVVNHPTEPDWALDSTGELLPTLQPACWALLADNILAIIAPDPADNTVDPETADTQLIETSRTATALAQGVLSDVPPRPNEDSPPPAVGVLPGIAGAHPRRSPAVAAFDDPRQLLRRAPASARTTGPSCRRSTRRSPTPTTLPPSGNAKTALPSGVPSRTFAASSVG